MKAKLQYLLLFLLLVEMLSSQEIFQRNFFPGGAPQTAHPSASTQTADSGLVLAGSVGISNVSPGTKGFLFRLNQNEDTLWTRYYSVEGASNSSIYAVDEDSEGNIIFSGSLIDTLAGGLEFFVWVTKADSGGKILWSNGYSFLGNRSYLQRGLSVKATNDGGYIVAGSAHIAPSGYDGILLKLDKEGNPEWGKIFSTAGTESFYSVDQTSDGGYILSGQTSGFSNEGKKPICIIRTDSEGDTLWTKNYQALATRVPGTVRQIADGNFIFAGSIDNASPEMGLIKFNGKGDTLWTKSYGGERADYGYSVVEMDDGGFALCGTTFSFMDKLHGNFFVVRTNSEGIVSWANEYGGTGAEDALEIHERVNGGLLISGLSDSWIPGTASWLIAADSAGNTVCNDYPVSPIERSLRFSTTSAPFTVTAGVNKVKRTISESSGGRTFEACVILGDEDNKPGMADFSLFPNPSNGIVKLKTSLRLDQSELSVYNLLGEKIKTIKGIEKGEITVSGGELASGVYFYTVTENGIRLHTGKFIIRN